MLTSPVAVRRVRCCLPAAHSGSIDRARRYYTFGSSKDVNGYVSNAYVNATRDTVNYIKKGGIPLVIGEWSLAGEQATRLSGYSA